jgi:serine/threonine-protein kinase RsbW
MSKRSSLRITADLENLTVVRRFVQETMQTLGVESDVVHEMVLAVDEAVSNIIVHGYQRRQGAIDVEIEQDGDALLVCLRDSAPPFDPTTVPSPDLTSPLERRAVGGLGVYLMRQSVDEVSHRVMPQGGNELTLVKRRIGGKNGNHGISSSR